MFIKKKREGHWDSGTTTHGTQQINSCSVVYKRKKKLTFFLNFCCFFSSFLQTIEKGRPLDPRREETRDETNHGVEENRRKQWRILRNFEWNHLYLQMHEGLHNIRALTRSRSFFCRQSLSKFRHSQRNWTRKTFSKTAIYLFRIIIVSSTNAWSKEKYLCREQKVKFNAE